MTSESQEFYLKNAAQLDILEWCRTTSYPVRKHSALETFEYYKNDIKYKL